MKKRIIVHIIFIVVLIVLANISLYYFIYFDDIRKNANYSTELYVNEKSNITYNIQTPDNNYYNYKNVDNYDINQINSVDTFYNYSITFDKTVEGEYTYYIKGYLYDTTEKIKEIYLSEEHKYNVENKNVITVNQLLNINIKNILKDNNISGMILPNLKYEMVVNYHVFNTTINKYISSSKTIEIDIPLINNHTIVISPYEEKGYKEFSNSISNNNKTYLIICLEFLGSIILYVLCIAYLIENIYPKTYVYDKELSAIKYKYKKYIVDIDFVPNLSKKEIEFVDDMNILVKYSKLYHVPIDCISVVEHKETVFAVIYDKKAYVYKLSVKRRK